MILRDEYIDLLARCFQQGLCLDVIDVDGKRNVPDVSDIDMFQYLAAEEALDKVDLDLLYDNAEAFQIPKKYPEFYEYLQELQLKKEDFGREERVRGEDGIGEDEADEIEEPEMEEPQNLSTRDQALKSIFGGEHTGNQRDSEKYRKNDEYKEKLNEEYREAMRSTEEQERYDAKHLEEQRRYDEERRESYSRNENKEYGQQYAGNSVDETSRDTLYNSPNNAYAAEDKNRAADVTDMHNGKENAGDVTNVVKGNTYPKKNRHQTEVPPYRQGRYERPEAETRHDAYRESGRDSYERNENRESQPRDLYDSRRTYDNQPARESESYRPSQTYEDKPIGYNHRAADVTDKHNGKENAGDVTNAVKGPEYPKESREPVNNSYGNKYENRNADSYSREREDLYRRKNDSGNLRSLLPSPLGLTSDGQPKVDPGFPSIDDTYTESPRNDAPYQTEYERREEPVWNPERSVKVDNVFGSSSHVYEPKKETTEQISGHTELNAKSAQEVTNVVRGTSHPERVEENTVGRTEPESARPSEPNTHSGKAQQEPYRGQQPDSLRGAGERQTSEYGREPERRAENVDRNKYERQEERYQKNNPETDSYRRRVDEDRNNSRRYTSDSYERTGQNRSMYESSPAAGNSYSRPESNYPERRNEGRTDDTRRSVATERIENRNSRFSTTNIPDYKAGRESSERNDRYESKRNDMFTSSPVSETRGFDTYTRLEQKVSPYTTDRSRDSSAVDTRRSTTSQEYRSSRTSENNRVSESNHVSPVTGRTGSAEPRRADRYVADSYGQAGQREYQKNDTPVSTEKSDYPKPDLTPKRENFKSEYGGSREAEKIVSSSHDVNRSVPQDKGLAGRRHADAVVGTKNEGLRGNRQDTMGNAYTHQIKNDVTNGTHGYQTKDDTISTYANKGRGDTLGQGSHISTENGSFHSKPDEVESKSTRPQADNSRNPAQTFVGGAVHSPQDKSLGSPPSNKSVQDAISKQRNIGNTYLRDSYSEAGQAPVSEKRTGFPGRDQMGQPGIDMRPKQGQADEDVHIGAKGNEKSHISTSKSGATIVAGEHGNAKGQRIASEKNTDQILSGKAAKGKEKNVVGKVSGAVATTAVATVLAAREAVKTASDTAKTAVDKIEDQITLKDTSKLTAEELANYTNAANSAKGMEFISGKQIADSYAMAGQADAQTMQMSVEQALANARAITASRMAVDTELPGAKGIVHFGASAAQSGYAFGMAGVIKNRNYTDVGIYTTLEGNAVTIFRNGKAKKYAVDKDGTISVDGMRLNVYAVDKNRAFVGWKNAAVNGGKIYTSTGMVLNVSTNGDIATTKTLDGLEFHIKRNVSVNATSMKTVMAMSMAPNLGQPITSADFIRKGDKFISNKSVESYVGLLYQQSLNEGKLSQLIFKQKMAMHSVFRSQVFASAAKNMSVIDLKLDLRTLVANYDKILISNSGTALQFCLINSILEKRYLSDLERQSLFDARAKLSLLGLTENTDTLKEFLMSGDLTPEMRSAITDYLNIYENSREKIIRKGILGKRGEGDFRIENAFYTASLPYVLQARGLPTDRKTLKELLKNDTTPKSTKKLIRNVFKLRRRMFLINLTETTLKAYAKGAIKGVKNGYRKLKSYANRYMSNDYTIRGLLMMESIFVGTELKAFRTAKKIKWMKRNSGKFVNASIRLGKTGWHITKSGAHATKVGARATRRGFTYLRKNGLKKAAKKGLKKIRLKNTKVVRKGVLKIAKGVQKVVVKTIQAAIQLIRTLLTVLFAALGPIIVGIIIVLVIVLCIYSYLKNSGDEVYYDSGDEDTTEVLQEMVDVLTLCHNSFRTELSNRFGGNSSAGSASGTDGSTMNAPQLQKGDSSKVKGLYDVAEDTWWNYEFTYQYIHGNWAAGTNQAALDTKLNGKVENNGNYAVVDQNGTKMYMAAFGSYWGKVGDVLKVEFNTEFTIGSQPATNTLYIIISDEKAWKDTGYPAEAEGIYGHHLGSHRDFAEFIGYGSQPTGLNGKGIIPVTATNMGSILDGTFDASTIGSGAATSSVSVNADILYRQEIDQDVYRDILNTDKNIYYTFPEDQEVPDGITPTPTPMEYSKETDTGTVYGFYNNNQELISMVMAMFDFDANSNTSTKSTLISKKDASGLDENKTDSTYQKGMTDKEIDDEWKMIEYLGSKGLNLNNYKAGGYDDLKYSALVGLFNASHIITGTQVKQYHAGPDGTINPEYNDEGKIIGQNNTDGMSYQVPVYETRTRQIKNDDGTISVEYYTALKKDTDGNIVYETRYAPCLGHVKYSGAVITLHFDSLLNLKEWWKENIYDVDDFDKENPNYESKDASADTYRAKENVLKRTVQYIKKPDFYKSLDGTCSESENSTTSGFNPGTWDGNQAEVAKQVYQFLTKEMSRPLTSEQAIGVLVNIYRECSMNYTEEEVGGTGYGLTQWSFERKMKLIQWCNANGYKYNTLEGQLKRLECEFTQDTSDWSPHGVDGLYNCSTAREAGEFFITNYERPAAKYKAQRMAEMDGDIATIKGMLQS